MPRIMRYFQVLHQSLWFHALGILDHPGLTSDCGAGSGFYCYGNNQGSDGGDHEHRKILVGKLANIFRCIMTKWSTGTTIFHAHIFSRWNFVQATCHLANKPKSWSQKCVSFTFLSCLCDSHEGIIMGGWRTDWFFPFVRLSELHSHFKTQGWHA